MEGVPGVYRGIPGAGGPRHRPRGRLVITVVDQEGKPVPNARVTVVEKSNEILQETLTYADGRTLFFPLKTGYQGPLEQRGSITISAERNGFRSSIDIQPNSSQGSPNILLEGTMNDGKSVGLDVLFLLDATGSMADEIHRIKTTLISIAQQVAGLPANPDIRFGMVAYRDRDDNYVTHIHPFDDRGGQVPR